MGYARMCVQAPPFLLDLAANMSAPLRLLNHHHRAEPEQGAPGRGLRLGQDCQDGLPGSGSGRAHWAWILQVDERAHPAFEPETGYGRESVAGPGVFSSLSGKGEGRALTGRETGLHTGERDGRIFQVLGHFLFPTSHPLCLCVPVLWDYWA